METNSWQSRLLNEKTELAARLDKLNDFLKSPNADTVGEEHLDLLYRQQQIMQDYLNILVKRIQKL
jgi:hypothetical protein